MNIANFIKQASQEQFIFDDNQPEPDREIKLEVSKSLEDDTETIQQSGKSTNKILESKDSKNQIQNNDDKENNNNKETKKQEDVINIPTPKMFSSGVSHKYLQIPKKKIICLFLVLFLVFSSSLVTIAIFRYYQQELLPLNVRFYPEFTGTYSQATLFDIQVKGSHNSYEMGAYGTQMNLDKSKPEDGGCLNVEIDLFPNKVGNDLEFLVAHEQVDQKKKLYSKDILEEINKWHLENENHFPLAITLDLKDEEKLLNLFKYKYIVKQIEELIRSVFTDESRVLMPKDLLQDYETLQEAVNKKGYPHIKDMKGKVYFVFSGRETDYNVFHTRQEYLKSFKDNIAFVDIDSRSVHNDDNLLDQISGILGSSGKKYVNLSVYLEENPNQIILNQHLPMSLTDYKEIEKVSENIKFAREKQLLVRGWRANDKYSWKLYRDMGVNLLTTDKVFGNYWTIMQAQLVEQTLDYITYKISM